MSILAGSVTKVRKQPKNIYAETISLCPECAKDCQAYYEEKDEGIYLNIECSEHGLHSERVESDAQFFKQRYEQEYEKDCKHLALPITYRCNLRCKYCYTLSNSSLLLPEDRPIEKLTGMIKSFDGNVTLIGGEATIRKDLLQIIRIAKGIDSKRKISIATNGQRLHDINFVKELKESGLDFVFLSFDDIEYEGSQIIHQNKIEALSNCYKLRMPVWLQRTIDKLPQLDSIFELLEAYKRVIFNVTIRTVKPFGMLYPKHEIFVSSIIKYLKKENDYRKGGSPFNNYITLKGENVKVCSWINDVKRIDPIDSNYIISDDTLTPFHRGMKMDEVLLKRRGSKPQLIS